MQVPYAQTASLCSNVSVLRREELCNPCLMAVHGYVPLHMVSTPNFGADSICSYCQGVTPAHMPCRRLWPLALVRGSWA